MLWPWVSRERLDQVHDMYFALATEYDELLDKYHALRIQGANPPLPDVPEIAPEWQQPKPKQEDAAKTLIHEVAGKNLKLRALMLKQLKADREAGKSEESIADAIAQGITSEGTPA